MVIRGGPEAPSLSPEAEPCPKSFSLGITGEVHGAGSTTTAKMLAKILEFSYEYAGEHFRELAVETGYAKDNEDDAGIVLFAQEYARFHPEFDAELDQKVVDRAGQGSCVFEGKAAVVLAKAGQSPVRNPTDREWVVTPLESSVPTFTVLLTCNERTAAQRILLRKALYQQRKNPLTVSAEERQQIIAQLDEKEIERQIQISQERMVATRQNWDNLYNLFQLEQGEGAYDLTIDTTAPTPEQVVGQIISNLREKALISSEQEKEALIALLLYTKNPHEVSIFFDNLDRRQAYNWTSLFLSKLQQKPELFQGSRWLIQALHCLTGPLPDLPEGVTQAETRGIFKFGDFVHLVRSSRGAYVSPHSQDIPLIMDSFCNKLDLILHKLTQLEQQGVETQRARFGLATWAYIMMPLIKPFWDGNGRVARQLFGYILGPNKKVHLPHDFESIRPLNSQINQRLRDVMAYFLGNNWLTPSSRTYFEEFREALLRNINVVRLTTYPPENPFFYIEFNLDYIFPLQEVLKRCIIA